MGMEELWVNQEDIRLNEVFRVCGYVEFMKKGLPCFELLRSICMLETKLQHMGDTRDKVGFMEAMRKLVTNMAEEENEMILKSLLKFHRNREKISDHQGFLPSFEDENFEFAKSMHHISSSNYANENGAYPKLHSRGVPDKIIKRCLYRQENLGIMKYLVWWKGCPEDAAWVEAQEFGHHPKKGKMGGNVPMSKLEVKLVFELDGMLGSYRCLLIAKRFLAYCIAKQPLIPL